MKRLLFIISLMILGITVKSQIASTKMQLSATEHDFGTFKEEAGRQSFDFIVTNTGTEPLVIQNVQASCGCTTPTWTKDPIEAGKKGAITVTYSTAGRIGVFTKTITVYTNDPQESVVLTITGEVIKMKEGETVTKAPKTN